MKDKANIFNIQRYSLHDGPGIRTLVFFKGCPLRCLWCANPEGIYQKNEVQYIKQKCTECGRCIEACSQNCIKATPEAGFAIERTKCQNCGACAQKCFRKAKMIAGYEISLDELMGKIRKDKAYFESSGGGVTLGGGDPIMQADFAENLLKACKAEGIGTAIETTAFTSFDIYKRCAILCDTVFTDFKAFDDEKHRALTGVSNTRIKDNLQRLGSYLAARENEISLIVRIPLLPDVNYTLSDMEQAADFFKTIEALTYIEILPFHNLGESKYEQLGLEYKFTGKDNLKAADLQEYAEVLRNADLSVKVTDW